MQRYCEGCQQPHDLDAFDLDRDETRAVCREYTRRQARAARAGARRKQQSRIEALEQRRRGLIAALVQIDQEIARERSNLGDVAPLFKRGETEDVFGDLEPGD